MKKRSSYYAVIFISVLNQDIKEYAKMSKKMIALAKEQVGFIGVDSARDKIGITVSYWKDKDAIANWRKNVSHQYAQKMGREKWYKHYSIKICKVEQEYKNK